MRKNFVLELFGSRNRFHDRLHNQPPVPELRYAEPFEVVLCHVGRAHVVADVGVERVQAVAIYGDRLRTVAACRERFEPRRLIYYESAITTAQHTLYLSTCPTATVRRQLVGGKRFARRFHECETGVRVVRGCARVHASSRSSSGARRPRTKRRPSLPSPDQSS